MQMKKHILAALREKFDEWEELLAGMSMEQINTPLEPSNWFIKDVIAHLWAWQQRSIARVEAVLAGREPEFPSWGGADPEANDNTDQINAWIYAANHDLPWEEVRQNWRNGFLRFLQSSEQVSERDLLDSGKYPWLDGYALAFFLLASYDHHQEHLENLQAWLHEHGS